MSVTGNTETTETSLRVQQPERSIAINTRPAGNGEVMKNMMKWMLAAAMVVGGLGLSATPAKAAQIGFYIGSGPAYATPSPGPGYAWINGFWANGYWVPGRWAFVGGYNGYANGYYGDRDDYYRHRDYYRDRDDHDRGDRYRDRGDRYRGHDRGDRWRGDRGRDHRDR